MLTWTLNADKTRTAGLPQTGPDNVALNFTIVPAPGGYFRLQVNGGWQGTRSSLTKLTALANDIAQGVYPLSPMTEGSMTMPSAESRKKAPKSDKPAKTQKPKASKPDDAPAQVEHPDTAPVPATTQPTDDKPQETPETVPATETQVPDQPTQDARTETPSTATEEPAQEGPDPNAPAFPDGHPATPKNVKETVVIAPSRTHEDDKPGVIPSKEPEDKQPEVQGTSVGSPDDPQPEARSSKGLRKVTALAGPYDKVPKIPEERTRNNVLAWCEKVRDVYVDDGVYVTVPALMHLARTLVKGVAEGASMAFLIKGIYDREVQAIAANNPTKAPTQQGAKVGPGKQSNTPTGTDGTATGEASKVTQGDRGGKRYELFGHAITGVLRAMGKAGWKFADARKALNVLGIECADATLHAQLRAGVKGERGDPAPLTAENFQALKDALGTPDAKS